MTDNAKWRALRLDDLERRGRFIPVREHLGIHSFGINAIEQGEDGTLINEHDEAGGQEEVYVVLDGTATFEIDGETVEAPAGTFVSVEPEARRKATGDATVLALGGTVGEAFQAMDWGEAWPIQNESMAAYGEQRYADACRGAPRPRAVPGSRGPQLQLRVLRDARRRGRRRDVRPPAAGRRAVSAVSRPGASGRGPRRRTRRPSVRGGSPLGGPSRCSDAAVLAEAL